MIDDSTIKCELRTVIWDREEKLHVAGKMNVAIRGWARLNYWMNEGIPRIKTTATILFCHIESNIK